MYYSGVLQYSSTNFLDHIVRVLLNGRRYRIPKRPVYLTRTLNAFFTLVICTVFDTCGAGHIPFDSIGVLTSVVATGLVVKSLDASGAALAAVLSRLPVALWKDSHPCDDSNQPCTTAANPTISPRFTLDTRHLNIVTTQNETCTYNHVSCRWHFAAGFEHTQCKYTVTAHTRT